MAEEKLYCSSCFDSGHPRDATWRRRLPGLGTAARVDFRAHELGRSDAGNHPRRGRPLLVVYSRTGRLDPGIEEPEEATTVDQSGRD